MQTWSGLNEGQQQALLSRPAMADNKALSSAVADIIQQVADNGDNALRELTRRFDGVELGELSLPMGELTTAEHDISHDG